MNTHTHFMFGTVVHDVNVHRRQSRLALRLNATLQTKQSQLRLQLALCCVVDAPCCYCSSKQWTCWLTLHRQMCCEHCFKLVEPLTWSVLKGKHVGVLLLFLVGSRELENNRRGDGYPASQWPWFESPKQYLHNVHSLQGPLGTAFLLQRLLSPGLGSPQGADFSLS